MKRYDYVALLKALKKVGLKQEALATELGVGQASISRWTSKDSEPSIDNYFAIVDLARKHGLVEDLDGHEKWEAEKGEFIAEIDLVAGLGGGGMSIIENTTKNGITFHKEVVRDHWRLPDWMLSRLGVHAQHVAAFPSRGDSMLPTIEDGDVVFIDTRHRVPSPPGIYALADEFGGVIVKRLEVTSRPGEEMIKVQISSDNPRHTTRELTLDEIQIVGRYIGRFTV